MEIKCKSSLGKSLKLIQIHKAPPQDCRSSNNFRAEEVITSTDVSTFYRQLQGFSFPELSPMTV